MDEMIDVLGVVIFLAIKTIEDISRVSFQELLLTIRSSASSAFLLKILLLTKRPQGY